MTIVAFFALLAVPINSYRTQVSPFPIEETSSPLPQMEQNTLPALMHPKRNCVIGKLDHMQKAFVREERTGEATSSNMYGLSLGWFGRKNGFAPSSSRYLSGASTQTWPLTLLMASGRFITPAISNIGAYSTIYVGDEKRLYNPWWLSELNLYQRRQESARYPGEILREENCNWTEPQRE